MPSIELAQGRVDYRVAGPENSTRPPVVFVHGLLVDGELWTRTADLLASAGIRSYAPTLPLGAHRTPLHRDTPAGPRAVAKLVADFVAALGLDDVTLVGNDTGGALCQFVIDAHPEHIGRLVLTNCDAFEKFPPAPFGLLVRVGRRPKGMRLLARAMSVRGLRDSYAGFGALAHGLDPQLTAHWAEPAALDAGVRHDTTRFLQQVRPADLIDVSTRLDRFDGPVLLPWGTDDRFFTPSLGRRLQAAFGDARIVELPGARTFVPLDAPDRLADEIARFSQRAHTPEAVALASDSALGQGEQGPATE